MRRQNVRHEVQEVCVKTVCDMGCARKNVRDTWSVGLYAIVRVVAWEGRSVCWAASEYGGKVAGAWLLVSARAQAGRKRRRRWRNNLSNVRQRSSSQTWGARRLLHLHQPAQPMGA